jgi:hypothetical protein
MNEDGVDLTNKESIVNEFILPGSYRKLIQRPTEMEWEILHYDHITTQLTYTDLDALYNRPKPQSATRMSTLALCVLSPSLSLSPLIHSFIIVL